MKIYSFSFAEISSHGDLFIDYLRLRKVHFVDILGWEISHSNGLEMDQYDNPQASYVVITEGETVVAGARILPCSADFNNWSYMIKDAHVGKLQSIPKLLNDCPSSDETWECTRLVIGADLSYRSRKLALQLIVDGLSALATDHGGNKLLAVSPKHFGKLLKSVGYVAAPLSEGYRCPEDQLEYRVFSTSCKPHNTAQTKKQFA